MNSHEFYIKRCITIAEKGLGSTAPNPMVGCVIVANETIIGEGFTSAYGGAHAEVNAINSVKDKSLLKQATLYVTLEPCSHYGKTPPCSDLIIKYGIPNVIIGCIDNNPEVAGKGIAKLKNSGCNVSVAVLENECRHHHKRFFTFHQKKRPYIILKWAVSKDGFIAPLTKEKKEPVWITSENSRQLVHKWRAEEQSILVGTNTVIEDNPGLTVRSWSGKNPIRIVIDKDEKLSEDYKIFNAEAETLKITANDIDFNNPVAQEICDLLYRHSINSVIIEGGLQTLQTFISENLWDEARVFVGNITFGKGINAPLIDRKPVSNKKINEDTLKIYVNN